MEKPLTLPSVQVRQQTGIGAYDILLEYNYFSFLRSEVAGIKPIHHLWSGAGEGLDGDDCCYIILKGNDDGGMVRGSYKEVAQMVWGDIN